MNARGLAWPDLVWSHFSRPRHDSIEGRIAAAAQAGFAGIGLWSGAWVGARDDGLTLTALNGWLDRHGVVLAEIEALAGWASTDVDVLARSRATEAAAYELADACDARYLQVIGPVDCSVGQAAERFAAVCDRAAQHGLLVGIEWLPFTDIRTADDAREIVELADRPNGGYCADIWHHVRSTNDLDMIRRLDPAKVFAIQMNDGPASPVIPDDYKADCLASRVPPGQGTFDCVGFIRTLSDMGVTAPISLEVCNPELWEAPVAEAAQRSADAMRTILDLAGAEP